MFSIHLPYELVESIIQGLDATKDAATLAAFALVNRNSTTMVRQLRFKKVVLYREDQCKKLSNFMKVTADIAGYIKSLALVDDSILDVDILPPGYGPVRGWLTSRADNLALFPVLKSLTALQSLEIRCQGRLQWSWVPQADREALFELFSTPTLQSLVLEGITNIDITSLIRCRNLKHLSLRQVTTTESNGAIARESMHIDRSGTQLAPGMLETLEITSASPSFLLLDLYPRFMSSDSKLKLDHLRRLVLQSGSRSRPDTWIAESCDLLVGTVTHLKEIRIQQKVADPINNPSALAFTKWPDLQVLELSFMFYRLSMEWMNDVLSGLESMSKLEKVQLELLNQPPVFDRPPPLGGPGLRTILRSTFWGRIDQLFASLPRLQHMLLVFNDSALQSMLGYPEALTFVRDQMPLLSAKQSVKFEIVWMRELQNA